MTKIAVSSLTLSGGVFVQLDDGIRLFFEDEAMTPNYIIRRSNGYSFLRHLPLKKFSEDEIWYTVTG